MTAAKMQQREEDRKHKGMEIYNQIKSGTKVENWTKESMDCLIAYYGIVNPEFIKDISSKHGQVSEYKLTQMIMKKAGLTNKQISEQLGISESAVRTMASRAFKGKKGFS